MKKACKSCMWFARMSQTQKGACGYANIDAGRPSRLKTVCDKYGIPYSKSGTMGVKALRELPCPCYAPGKRPRRVVQIARGHKTLKRQKGTWGGQRSGAGRPKVNP